MVIDHYNDGGVGGDEFARKDLYENRSMGVTVIRLDKYLAKYMNINQLIMGVSLSFNRFDSIVKVFHLYRTAAVNLFV